MKGASMIKQGRATVTWVAVLCVLSGITNVITSDAKVLLLPTADLEPLASHDCPAHCQSLFGKLEDGQIGSRGRVQHVEVQERGEPKSGTGFMYEWATGALGHSCVYLQRAYGMGSCRIEWDFANRTLIFEPHVAMSESSTPPCHCDGIDRCEKKRLLLVSTLGLLSNAYERWSPHIIDVRGKCPVVQCKVSRTPWFALCNSKPITSYSL